MIVYNTSTENFNPVHLNGNIIPVSDSEKHLGCYIGKDSASKRISKSTCEIYSNTNKLLGEFYMADIDVKYCLFKCFCLPLYGATPLQYEGKGINKLYIAWRKSIRKLPKVSPRMHCDLLHEIFITTLLISTT